jgi:hypothetical protein
MQNQCISWKGDFANNMFLIFISNVFWRLMVLIIDQHLINNRCKIGARKRGGKHVPQIIKLGAKYYRAWVQKSTKIDPGYPRIDLGEMPDRRWSHFWTGRSQGPPRARGLVKNKTIKEHLVDGLTCQGRNATSHFIIRSSHSYISNSETSISHYFL